MPQKSFATVLMTDPPDLTAKANGPRLSLEFVSGETVVLLQFDLTKIESIETLHQFLRDFSAEAQQAIKVSKALHEQNSANDSMSVHFPVDGGA